MIFSFIYKNINFIVFQLNNKSTYFHKESNGMNKMIHFGNLGIWAILHFVLESFRINFKRSKEFLY